MARPVSTKYQTLNNFMKKFDINDSGCWVWFGTKSQTGYGLFWDPIRRKTVKAHRISYRIFNGNIKENLLVMHSCDNKLCVNPKHLSTGNHKDNSTDMIVRGRSTRGEKSGTAKLTQSQVDEIRKIYKKREFGCLKISRIFGTSKSNVTLIVNGDTWKNKKEIQNGSY